MANWDPQLVTPTLAQAPTVMGGPSMLAGGAVRPHHGLIGIVLLAAIVLVVLDRAGFRFAITVGRR
jgi:hypothetical protein